MRMRGCERMWERKRVGARCVGRESVVAERRGKDSGS